MVVCAKCEKIFDISADEYYKNTVLWICPDCRRLHGIGKDTK